ncbi:MAG TPA: pseudouridine synthase [Polyangia bacterium]|nr:pseudouridine synthase [Polyangia bacterium]
MAGAIELLYVDDDVVVADKPSGLSVHRGWDDDDDVAMFRVRDAIGARVHPVHRLDRGTSGALLFARTAEAAATLGRAFADGHVDKRYLALVRGAPPATVVVDHPVPETEGGARVPAVTRLRLVARSTVERCSLVEARPETGRFHQIRRHLKHLSHPIVGDVNYGKGDLNRLFRTRYGLHRLALHAHLLAFDHPATGRRLVVRAPLPADFAAALAALGLPVAVDDEGAPKATP